jgi:Acetoacetate decarboxylase (ADC)
MPLTNPAFPSGPYRFINREYFIIQYRMDPEALRRLVPEPLALTEPVVNYEFIRMPDSTGFGDYTESGQGPAVPFFRAKLVLGGVLDALRRAVLSRLGAWLEDRLRPSVLSACLQNAYRSDRGRISRSQC